MYRFNEELQNNDIESELIRLAGKKMGGPIAVAGESGQLTTLNCLIDFYLVNEMTIPSSIY